MRTNRSEARTWRRYRAPSLVRPPPSQPSSARALRPVPLQRASAPRTTREKKEEETTHLYRMPLVRPNPLLLLPTRPTRLRLQTEPLLRIFPNNPLERFQVATLQLRALHLLLLLDISTRVTEQGRRGRERTSSATLTNPSDRSFNPSFAAPCRRM